MNHSGSSIASVGWTIELPRVVSVHNSHGSQVLYVGWGSDVSTSNGLPVPAGESRKFRLSYLDEMWAVASGADTVALVSVVHGKGNPTTFDVLSLSPALWLDASDESTLSGPGGGAVSQWDDKSGNGNNLTQATASLQPTTGTRTLNGLNVLDFIPNDVISAASFNISQPITLFAVATLDTSGATPQFLVNGSSTAFQAINQTARLYSGTNLQGSTSLALSTGLLFRYTADSTSSSIYVDGSLDVSGDAGTSGMTVLDVGNQAATGRQWDGTIAELIVVDGTLTAQQISDTESYLADKWGITI
jgi:hypothetical protein